MEGKVRIAATNIPKVSMSHERDEKVLVDLSIDETNKLRAELGLAPLRLDKNSTKISNTSNVVGGRNAVSSSGDNDQVLELSVCETNLLRQQLGLPPLRTSGSTSSGSRKEPVHAPAENESEKKEALDRLEKARLKRLVEDGIVNKFGGSTLADDSTSAHDWAKQMLGNAERKNDKRNKSKRRHKIKTEEKEKGSEIKDDKNYTESDLLDLNVAHSIGEFQEGTTVLTLADAPILKTAHDTSKKVLGMNEDDMDALENVTLQEQKRQQTGIREKRKVELGLGHAGGYAGYDDDEFEELGGTQAPTRFRQNQDRNDVVNDSNKNKKHSGFTIADMLQQREEQMESDLFASASGKAISLQSSYNGDTEPIISADFMTAAELEQDAATLTNFINPKKIKKDKKKKDKKSKRAHRKERVESDDDNDDENGDQLVFTQQKSKSKKKLKRSYESDKEDAKMIKEEIQNDSKSQVNRYGQELSRDVKLPPEKMEENDEYVVKSEQESGEWVVESATKEMTAIDEFSDEDVKVKRSRYEEIVAKANDRSKSIFDRDTKNRKVLQSVDDDVDLDAEADDAFLNAALSKARRLNRLKAISATTTAANSVTSQSGIIQKTGADAIAEAVEKYRSHTVNLLPNTGKTITFAIDDTLEFTRALKARTEQTDRTARKNNDRDPKSSSSNIIKSADFSLSKPAVDQMEIDDDSNQNNTNFNKMDLHELEKQVKKEEDEDAKTSYAGDVLDGTSARSIPLGRGLGNMLNLLKHTGEMTRMNAGKEEMRGRAKDKRTYEDYEPLDLKNLVKIDERTAQSKDIELANREIKLEYRDKHGRLLTRKEAFRDLCYQFHGYGSGKRKQEKKLKQIEQEQAQNRLTSRQATSGTESAGTFGALQATQKATGKAFVVHKTT